MPDAPSGVAVTEGTPEHDPARPATRDARQSPATDAAFALLLAFADLGVRDVVVSPGSRSQALALAAARLHEAGRMRLHVRIDERGGAFFALGAARESGVPTLVVTTSGTAVANLHPAVLEAHHSGIPLIALTADRPEELRGIRANQTTRQPGIFGTAVRLGIDVPAPTAGDDSTADARALAERAVSGATDPRNPGPVHLNLQYREPLSSAGPTRPLPEAASTSPEASPEHSTASAGRPSAAAREHDEPLLLAHGPRTVVIAGADAGEDAEALAREADWPLIAEVTSGAHFGPNLVVGYRELLAHPEFGGAVERVIVFGHPTLSREVPALVQRDDVDAVVVAPADAEQYNPGRRVRRFVRAVRVHEAQRPDERRWTRRWVMTSRALLDEDSPETPILPMSGGRQNRRAFLEAEMAVVRTPVDRRMLAAAVWNATWPHDRLVFGASRIIREADRSVPGKRIRAVANRGLAGIDGTIATTLGVASASQAAGEPGTTRALIGDVTLLHDAGSLHIAPGEPRPRVLVVVGNDGGGTIFDTLEVAASADAASFDRVLYTPHTVDIAALAAAYGWQYRRAQTRGELNDALTAPVTEPTILEVPLPR
ncbi:2-succinyl-5-enolpyruvyl-6-hydroxy-3-cyclohexene-1-carboxylic-acid synthase [Rathayibacter sp. YIM 133350]|uniref:2-succinyl-5-enolpyruvyl-6-hydroxy-3- cyclohexene-1-carboxylic-acid synthase n=1 Tax=Rathayibacter sp. YIM 133350 TaxID=3131992 RepID=UPI00307E746C